MPRLDDPASPSAELEKRRGTRRRAGAIRVFTAEMAGTTRYRSIDVTGLAKAAKDAACSGPGWWLRVRCACGQTTDLPTKLLLRRHGPREIAPALLLRMRCSRCGARPASADFIDNPAGGALGSGYPEPRRVPVLYEVVTPAGPGG